MKTVFQPILLAVFVVSHAITAQAQTNYEPYPFTTFAGLAGISGSANGTGSAARFNFPNGVATDAAGNVYVADSSNHVIRKITPAKVVTTLAGSAETFGSVDGTGSAARFFFPVGVAADAAGNIYVADSNNHAIRKITPAGVVTTLAGLLGSSGNADGTGGAAHFNFPQGVAVDGGGNVYVADSGNNTIRKITRTRSVTTLAGQPGSSGSNNGTGDAARFNFPVGIAVNGAGTVYVADTNNSTIRKITPAGHVTLLAGEPQNVGDNDGSLSDDGFGSRFSMARFNFPEGVAVDSVGDVYVADTGNGTIRKITPAFGVVRTLAGLAGNFGSVNGAGANARFKTPFGIAINSAGKVYVADASDHTIRIGGPAPTTPTQTIDANDDNDESDDLPQTIGPDNTAFGQATTFQNLPNYTSLSVSFEISHPAPGEFLRVTVYPGRPDETTSRPRANVPVFVAFNRERLVNAAGQPVTDFRCVVALPQSIGGQPFLGSDTYTVQVLNDTFSGATTRTGTFKACSLTINPENPGHAGPPTVTLREGSQASPLPAQVNINYGDPLTLVANAAGNPSSYFINRLGIVISPSPAPNPRPSPQPAAIVYRSDVLFQKAPSTSPATVTFSPPPLPPGNYQITATAFDSAGFSKTTAANLRVNRLFGLFNVEVESRVENPDFTTNFNATLTLRNLTPTTSGSLRVRLVSVPTPAFRDQDGPPDLSGYPPTNLSPIYLVNPIPPGGKVELRVAGKVRAPVADETGTPRFINFDIVAVLEELVRGQWRPVDSRKVTEGVHDRPEDFGGPGGGVNDPGGGLGGTPSDPLVLQSVMISGPATMKDSAQTQFMATATASNSLGSIPPVNVTADPRVTWSVSSPFTISPTGVLKSGRVFTKTNATVEANFTLGGITRTDTHIVTVLPTSTALGNISTRAQVATGDNVLIAGFIVSGPAGSTKKVFIRGRGPSLGTQGVANSLSNPRLELHPKGGPTVSNDNWRDGPNTAEIPNGFAPSDDRESVIIATLPAGGHTAILSGVGATSGVGQVEVYDISSSTPALLANISTRSIVGTGDSVMIAGFIISGPPGMTKKVLIRGIGPALATANVPNFLPDPVLELHKADKSVLTNDNWRDGPNTAEIPNGFAPKDNRESVIIATLPPGAHTAILKGAGGVTGVGLVEVYDLQ